MSSQSDEANAYVFAKELLAQGYSADDIKLSISAEFPGITEAGINNAFERATQAILAEQGLGYRPDIRQPPAGIEQTIPQWRSDVDIIKPDGELVTQEIRVERNETDTDEDARQRLLRAAAEIQSIIAERGGDYDVQVIITSIEPI